VSAAYPNAAFDLYSQLLLGPSEVEAPLARWSELILADVARESRLLKVSLQGALRSRPEKFCAEAG
jgi:hypothetical protein